MSQPYGSEMFRDDPESKARAYKLLAEGKWHSKWDFLRHALVSNLTLLGHRTAKLLSSWQISLQRGDSPGDTEALVFFNYIWWIYGPAVASIILTSFAVEPLSD